MQTFLPYASFLLSARCLDNRRLNKQIIEAKTIYDIIVQNRTKGAWVNHPIVKMWRDYPEALALYHNECLHQWKDARKRKHSYEPIKVNRTTPIDLPYWLEDWRLCESHRANLLRKDFEFYSKYDWPEKNMEYWSMPYWWGEFGYGKIPKQKRAHE